MTNNNEPRYDWEDPITHTVRQAGQTVTQSIDRVLQLGYMLRAMQSERLQQQLDTLNQNGTTYQTPETVDQLTTATNNVKAGDLVAYNPAQTRLGRVTTTSPDGQIEVAPLEGGEPQIIQPGDYGVIPQQAQAPDDSAEPDARPRPPVDEGLRPEVKKPLEPGEMVSALDRGNQGRIMEIDGEHATVRFTNSQTGASRDVRLPLVQLRRKPAPQTRPDPRRLGAQQGRNPTAGPDRARLANPQNTRPHNRRQPPPGRRRPPGPKPK